VKPERLKKVFAIFKHPCYNIHIVKLSSKNKLANFALNRFGAIIGVVLFFVAIALSDNFVLKIKVTGSGSYLESEVLSILDGADMAVGKYAGRLNKPLAQSEIMALPNVTFCTITQRGSVLVVDVQADGQNNLAASRTPLYCDERGKVVELVAVCGTPLVNIGDTVENGDCLIAPYFVAADGTVTDCFGCSRLRERRK
jgi:hypothetical protein